MGYSDKELADIQGDAEYWRTWGGALGLTLHGFTRRDSATFFDQSGEHIRIDRTGYSTNFRLFDRLRTQLLGS